MKAAQFNHYGAPSVIEINENAIVPQPSEGQILVEVTAAGLNPVESAIRGGYLKQMLSLTFPANLGGDFSGKVVQVGENVTHFKVDDEVYGIANQLKGGTGSIAELVTANAANSAHKPISIDHTHSAALPLVGTSAIQALEEHIKIKEGQKILIQGGAGGIGSLAMQIAKAHKAYVATTVSTDDVEFAKSLGADEVIDYKTQDVATLMKDFDAVFDTVGGEVANQSISFLKEGGILVSMSGQPDQELAKKQGITALTQMTKGDTQQLTRLRELVDETLVKPVVQTIFPIEQVKEAYEALEKHPRGKVVIKIR